MNNIDTCVIELKELRIGNLLEYKGELVQVTSLSCDIDDEYEEQICFVKFGASTNEIGGWNRSLVNDLKRIPLTPDWLVRLSFTRFANGAYHKDVMCTWRVWYDDLEKAATYCTDVYPELGHAVYLPIRIDYIHQLQNIYFTMTGEELTIKGANSPVASK
jgi:hypothetical protein